MTDFLYNASVIIPNWNGMAWLPGCLDALQKQSTQDFEILVVDNGSSDDSLSFIRTRYPEVKIVALDNNYGFSVAVNSGIKNATGKYLVLLNNDTLPDREWLSRLLEVIENAPVKVGSLASLMVSMEDPSYTDDAGDFLDWHGLAYKRGYGEPSDQWTRNEPVFSACAGAALYRREFLESTGLFDEKFGSYLEDIDIGLRGNLLGFSCMFVPSARVLHKSHGSAMPSGMYVYHITKNRMRLFFKNIPGVLLIRHAGTLFTGQAHSFLVYKDPSSSLRAFLHVLWNVPAILRDRRGILPKVVLSNHEIESLLNPPQRSHSYSGRIA